ncbi:MAG: DUF2811 domain-containing protein, partial [Synechococcaceae cyanobacterium]|nr:DUF2811 domain-containing protein [Synechococcaceae cyanobacterium]
WDRRRATAGAAVDVAGFLWGTGAHLEGQRMASGAGSGESGGTVSLRAEVPEPLLVAMRGFIERHPSWDQYRLFQAALAGFLVQNGVRNRGVTRCYLANLFPAQGRFTEPPPTHRPGQGRSPQAYAEGRPRGAGAGNSSRNAA